MTSSRDEDGPVVEMLPGHLGLSFAPVCSSWKANHQKVTEMAHEEATPHELSFGSPSSVCALSLFRPECYLAGLSIETMSQSLGNIQ